MFCPKCKAEYRQGFATCSDCNISLVQILRAEVEEPLKSDANILPPQYQSLLVSTNYSAEARIIHDSLISNGIKTHVESKDTGPITGLMSAALPQYNIFGCMNGMLQMQRSY
jgi:hypothetical protein